MMKCFLNSVHKYVIHIPLKIKQQCGWFVMKLILLTYYTRIITKQITCTIKCTSLSNVCHRHKRVFSLLESNLSDT